MRGIFRFDPRLQACAAVTLAVLLLAAGSSPVPAQSGGGKETEELQEKVEDSRGALQGAVAQIKETMGLYNTLVAGKAEKTESVYKDLSKSTGECDKAAEGARKSVESLRKDLEKFYKEWEKEIETYSSDSMKERSRKSLDQVKAKFDSFNAALQGASDLYKPFIASLRDQVTFMGRDLSPAALAELKDEGATLNESAEALYAKVDEALAATQPGATAAPAEPAGETGEEAPAAGEEPGGEAEEGGGE
ncbi:MAG TPA: DUF2959 family protein [Candidatus Polarisedimenticolia bacterium]|nr:DUF2959 family protein [Candidatus Polarisedimenticolia bacterium]